MRKLAAIAVAVLLAGVVAAEFGARAFIGFPLIWVTHPAVEYMAAPNQTGRHRGIGYAVNAWGMRSGQIAETKADNTLRVAVFGDSIVFGHSITPQDDLATSRLSAAGLPDGRRIEALNIAANSWGPGNQLAFIESYGLFDADAAILVISTHDLADDRAFEPLPADWMPTERMPMALLDWTSRRRGEPRPIEGAPEEDMSGDARRALPALLGRLRAPDMGACLLMHETLPEREGPPNAAARQIIELAGTFDIPVVMTRDFIAAGDFADDIHPTAKGGQEGLANAMRACPALAAATSEG